MKLNNYLQTLEANAKRSFEKREGNTFIPYTDKELSEGGSAIWLTSILSKTAIGYAKAPIMLFEKQMVAYLYNTNQTEQLTRINNIVSNLNTIYTQPTISVQKWNKNLPDAIRLMIKIQHLSNILKLLLSSFPPYDKAALYFVNKYIFLDEVFKDGKRKGKIKEAFEFYYHSERSTFPTHTRKLYSKIFKLIDYHITDFISLNKINLSERKNKPADINAILNYLENELENDLNELAGGFKIEENFYHK